MSENKNNVVVKELIEDVDDLKKVVGGSVHQSSYRCPRCRKKAYNEIYHKCDNCGYKG